MSCSIYITAFAGLGMILTGITLIGIGVILHNHYKNTKVVENGEETKD